jgi:hypothetical protein
VSNWQPSRFDTAVIDGASAVVDAIAQDAGSVVVLSSGAAAPAALTVQSGSLFARGNVQLNASAGATSTLTLSGGKLIVAGTVSGTGTGNTVVNFTGGTLVAGSVDATAFDSPGAAGTLVQNGSTSRLAPGDVGVAGRTAISGSYRLTAGSLQIDLGAASAATSFQNATPAFDVVSVSGTLTLGANATLALATMGGYDPQRLVSHLVVPAGATSGVFASVSGHQITANKWLAVTYDAAGVSVTATTPGDANLDGAVNFDDLLRLAASYNASAGQSWSTGDFTGNGATNFDDLLILASFYNTSPTAEFAMARTIVPEPTTVLCMVAATLSLGRFRMQAH